jgi:glycosyltransferase involved in cell wall biosynthesis
MIVKDEAEVIERCLLSCRHLIDRWVICDTGSSDGTPELIRRALDGIPGELHHEEWVDFGVNRTELMRLAHGTADYLLLLDADMTLMQSDALPALRASSYMLGQGDPEIGYLNKRLVRGDLRWRYVGSTHEYIECIDEEISVERLDMIAVRHHADGQSWTNKFERDLTLLSAELEREPDRPRTRFYLAQTYRDIANNTGEEASRELSLEHYQRRAEMAGWSEETYFARYQVGILSAQLGDWPRAADAFVRAWEERPGRLEAVQALVAGLRERGLYRSAHRFATLATATKTLAVPDDLLFVAPWVYKWGMLFEYSITAYWVGEFEQSISACAKLLRRADLPDPYREQTRTNMQCGMQERVRLAAEQPRRARRLAHVGHPTRGLPA